MWVRIVVLVLALLLVGLSLTTILDLIHQAGVPTLDLAWLGLYGRSLGATS